jgi:hypothetical protein
LLATLILANCGNVKIINKVEDAEENQIVINSTKLELLSLERHHEVFASEQLLITA